MARPTREGTLVNLIRDQITRRWPDAVLYKIHGSPVQEAGIPDLLGVIEGRAVGIEVKLQRPGESRQHALGRVSAIQARQLRRISAAGGVALVGLDPAEVVADLEQALAPDY